MAPTLLSSDRMAAIYGVSVEDLHDYETLGLLQPVLIDGARHYSARDRLRLEVVLKGLSLRFSLDEITAMVLGRLVVSANSQPQAGFDRDRVVDELRGLLARQGCSDVTIDDLKSLLRLE